MFRRCGVCCNRICVSIRVCCGPLGLKEEREQTGDSLRDTPDPIITGRPSRDPARDPWGPEPVLTAAVHLTDPPNTHTLYYMIHIYHGCVWLLLLFQGLLRIAGALLSIEKFPTPTWYPNIWGGKYVYWMGKYCQVGTAPPIGLAVLLQHEWQWQFIYIAQLNTFYIVQCALQYE